MICSGSSGRQCFELQRCARAPGECFAQRVIQYGADCFRDAHLPARPADEVPAGPSADGFHRGVHVEVAQIPVEVCDEIRCVLGERPEMVHLIERLCLYGIVMSDFEYRCAEAGDAALRIFPGNTFQIRAQDLPVCLCQAKLARGYGAGAHHLFDMGTVYGLVIFEDKLCESISRQTPLSGSEHGGRPIICVDDEAVFVHGQIRHRRGARQREVSVSGRLKLSLRPAELFILDLELGLMGQELPYDSAHFFPGALPGRPLSGHERLRPGAQAQGRGLFFLLPLHRFIFLRECRFPKKAVNVGDSTLCDLSDPPVARFSQDREPEDSFRRI
ncbi:MAG: hypothetical protein BWZ01_01382 [Deltaproteobacteria bacterium ADurb.BinA179]|nr:MAG: hypothetical protein BWZ01_01382 [Deltaproteobacteria bacterium ADurb.BinA179]